jgi:hypothetical protein
MWLLACTQRPALDLRPVELSPADHAVRTSADAYRAYPGRVEGCAPEGHAVLELGATFRLSGREVTDLVPALTALHDATESAVGCPVGDGRLLVVAPRDLPFGRLAFAVDQGRQAGYRGFDLLVDDPTPGDPVQPASGALQVVTLPRDGLFVGDRVVAPADLQAALGARPGDVLITADSHVPTADVLRVHDVVTGLGGRVLWAASPNVGAGAATAPSPTPLSAGDLAVLRLDLPRTDESEIVRVAPPAIPVGPRPHGVRIPPR